MLRGLIDSQCPTRVHPPLRHGVNFRMNAGNAILLTVGALMAGFVLMLSDASSAKPASRALQDSQLRSALASGQPVLLEFYADWCGPCRMVGPVVDALAKELHGKARVVRLNVDQHGELAREYGVRGIPAFIALKNGREVSRQSGAIDKATMRSMIGL